jgi:hypothetical protein
MWRVHYATMSVHRTIVIAIDDSFHSEFAFDCKLLFVALKSHEKTLIKDLKITLNLLTLKSKN